METAADSVVIPEDSDVGRAALFKDGAPPGKGRDASRGKEKEKKKKSKKTE